jgi:hypothetical protein
MADTTFRGTLPPLKARDNGDGTYSVATILMGFLVEYIHRLFGSSLTSDGIQWSNEVDTGAPDVDVVVLETTCEPGIDGALLLLEFGVTAAFKAVSSGTADVKWKWQVRNKDGTWVDLHDYVTETNIGTNYVERTRSGYFEPTTNITEVPFDVRLVMQCNEANEGRAKVKNSSYVKVVYSAS